MINAEVRAQLRPHGVVSLSCHQCPWLDRCGGIEPERSLLSCIDLCRGDCRACDRVCPRRRDFFERLSEVKGLRYRQNIALEQSIGDLPRYIPMVHHGYSRAAYLEIPIVALGLYQLFHLVDGYYRCYAESSSELRERYRLAPQTRIILVGTGKDRFLERYWRYRRRDEAARCLARLQIDGVIASNFSHFLDVPRTDNLFNRKRQLICLEEFQRAGLSPIPHLNAITAGDWRFWRDYLRDNSRIRYVAVEFQTGNRSPNEGKRVIRQLVWLQDQLGRMLHPLAIGGSRFTECLAREFAEFTISDSRPFMNAIKRRMVLPGASHLDRLDWISRQTGPDEPIDDVLVHNIRVYDRWLSLRCRMCNTSSAGVEEHSALSAPAMN
jgi:hypothetical protein